MWFQKWIWERYKELWLKIGRNREFTFAQAKEILQYDSNQTVYKLLNELEQSKIITVERTKKDGRTKKYKIVLDLKDIPYSYLKVPSDYKARQKFLPSTGSMTISGASLFLDVLPSKAFERVYDKESERFVTIVPEKQARTMEEFITKMLQDYKSPEAILKIIKEQKINFTEVLLGLNSYQKRYLGALLEILQKDKKMIEGLYELTKNDKRIFSIFPKKVRKIPKKYKKISRKWRINLNIDVVNIHEL